MSKNIDASIKIKEKFISNKSPVVDFTQKVISFLKAKTSSYNKNNYNHKVSTHQIKEAYKRGVYDAIRLEKPINLWAIARVNMFLKMAKGSSVPHSYKKLDRDILNDQSFFIDDGVRDDIIFTYEQISEARFESESFNLNFGENFDFIDTEEFFTEEFNKDVD